MSAWVAPNGLTWDQGMHLLFFGIGASMVLRYRSWTKIHEVGRLQRDPICVPEASTQ